MKKFVVLFFAFICWTSVNGQAQLPHPELLKEGKVTWEQNQLVVRFSDQLSIQFNGEHKLGIPAIDAILNANKLIDAKQLFSIQKQIPDGAVGFTTYTGQYVQYPKLTNIYLLKFDTIFVGTSIFEIINELQQHQDQIVYAEPNYRFKLDSNPVDALYQYQYNTTQMNVDSVWAIMQDSSVTDSDIVIGIIDTGVDTTHADLHGKQYFNMFEVNGLPGVDDDNNGFIDDKSGWDFVNLDNHPADDNSHGTHCAGIAVAAHNQIGIAGVSKGAKYMPIKGLESSGGSSASVLAQGVIYAANNGADILSMSFGGYGRSLALENALAYAYAFSLPVGAAGNDGLCIRNDGQLCPDGRFPAPMYPGAYTFVLAAQATQQNSSWNGFRVWFSNFDFDGPTFTDYPDDFNYEVYAPGTYIVSTIPGGGYATFSGTSMACPAVAGSAAMYMAFRPNNSKEKLFIDYIMSWYDIQGTFTKNQGGQFPSMDLVKAIWPDEQPMIWNKGITVIDSAQGDGDNKLDAGEVVQLRTDVKNLGSPTDSVFVGLRVSQFEDPSVINLTDSVAYVGSLSSYASGSNNTNMFEFVVNPNVVNGRNISFNVFAWVPGGDTTSQDFVLEAQAGCEFNGIYSGTTILSPACDVIITGNTIFDTLIIKPGTRIQLDPQVGLAYSHIVANGTPDSVILFTKNINSYGTWSEVRNVSNQMATFRYCVFEYGGRYGGNWGSELLVPGSLVSLEDCVIRYCHSWYGQGWNIIKPSGNSSVLRTNILYNQSNLPIVGLDNSNWNGYFKNNIVADNIYHQYYGEQPAVVIGSVNSANRIKGNTALRHKYTAFGSTRKLGYAFGIRDGNGGGHTFSQYTNNYLDSNYFGTTTNSAIESNIYDFQEISVFPSLNGSSKKLINPKRQTHGHVHSITLDAVPVNIINNPVHHVVGLGSHKVVVRFNRPMDVATTPFVTYGVRNPFTQNIISDSASWSTDSLTWSGKFVVSQLTSSDGFNKISVRNAKDNQGFEIPIEDYRFEFRLNVAGALSTGFNAVGDSSEIRLNWSRPDSIIDLLGYNVYRIDTTMDVNGDGYYGDTVLINSILVMDTAFVDENVIGGKFYRYHYTALRSNLTESQMSIGVWCTPYAAAPRVRTKKAIQTALGSIKFDSEIDANFIATNGRFQFGTNKGNLSNSTQWVSAGSDYKSSPFQTTIQSVQPGLVYYYRVQAQNSLGIRSGKVDSILSRSIPQIQITTPLQPCIGSTISPLVNIVSPDTTVVLSYIINGGPAQATIPSYLVTNPNPIVFTVTATGLYSQTTTQTQTVIPISPSNAPVSLAMSGPTTFCAGGTVTLSAPTGVNSVTWNTGQTGNSIVVSSSGTFTASYITSDGCSITSNSVTVAVNSLPQSSIVSPSGSWTFCAGSTLSLGTSSTASSYQWFRNGSAISGANSATFGAALPGTYSVQLTTNQGCSNVSSAVQVSESALPPTTIVSSNTGVLCAGDSVTLTAPAGFSYLWSTGATSQYIKVVSSGVYSVSVSNSAGCNSQSSPTQIAFNPIPVLNVSTSGPLTICHNGFVTLTAASGFSSYLWSNGATTQSIIATSQGAYSVTGYTAAGCAKVSNVLNVAVTAAPVATITPSSTANLCVGDTLTLSAPAGYSYLWSTGATTQSISVVNSGIFSVTVSTAAGCNLQSAPLVIAFNPVPVINVSASGPLTICPNNSVTLTASPGFSSYLWSNGATSQSIVVSNQGAYSVVGYTPLGCTALSSTVNIVVSTVPTFTISANGPTNFCVGDSVQLTLNNATGPIIWSTGSSGQTIWVKSPGVYSASIIVNGCSFTSNTLAIGLLSQPTKPTVYFSTIANLLISSAPAGNQWKFNGTEITGEIGTTLTPSQNGIYSVITTNISGCSSESDGFNYVNLGITDIIGLEKLKIYPNPTAGLLVAELSNVSDGFTIKVYDSLGRCIQESFSNTGTAQINMSNFSSGVYRIEAIWPNGISTQNVLKY